MNEKQEWNCNFEQGEKIIKKTVKMVRYNFDDIFNCHFYHENISNALYDILIEMRLNRVYLVVV